jgi:hypothetical protein
MLYFVLVTAGALAALASVIGNVALRPASGASSEAATGAAQISPVVHRYLYAVNQSSGDRGSISVYDIDQGHRPIKTIRTVPRVGDVRGIAASAATGRLYVAYRSELEVGMIFCLNLYNDTIVWNRIIDPGVDRLAIDPDGRLLYVPTWEGGSADFINVLDAAAGEIVRKVHFSNRSHDAQFPLSGPLFQETKASDGSGRFLYLVDPGTYAVSRIGPYAGVLGPYSVDSMSIHVVNNVTDLWGMQVAELRAGQIVTANIPDHPPGEPGLLHGIGWTPDEKEVWQSSSAADPHIYVWSMANPMAPILKEKLALRGGRGSHWLTFDIKGQYGYVAPNKGGDEPTEIFDAHTHASVGVIASTEDLLEIQFTDGLVTQVGDQYGIGRASRR